MTNRLGDKILSSSLFYNTILCTPVLFKKILVEPDRLAPCPADHFKFQLVAYSISSHAGASYGDDTAVDAGQKASKRQIVRRLYKEN